MEDSDGPQEGPEQVNPAKQVDANAERARAAATPQNPRRPGQGRLDETSPGGVYFHATGGKLAAHNAHGEPLDDVDYPDGVQSAPSRRAK